MLERCALSKTRNRLSPQAFSNLTKWN